MLSKAADAMYRPARVHSSVQLQRLSEDLKVHKFVQLLSLSAQVVVVSRVATRFL